MTNTILTQKSQEELNFATFEFTAQVMLSKYNDKELWLNPDYQRNYVWDDKKASKLIESCLLGIPLPNLYLYDNNNRYEVIDGVQRLTSIIRYMNDKFALSSLTIFEDINNKKFSDLEISTQRLIKNYAFRCVVLKKDNDPKTVREIFSRLNSGGLKLEGQEMRSALYPSLFNNMLDYLGGKIKDLITKTSLEKIKRTYTDPETGDVKIINEIIDRKFDEEAVLRYFAFCYENNFEGYRGADNLSTYLDIVMKKYSETSESNMISMENKFLEDLQKCKEVFVDKTFKGMATGKLIRVSFAFYDIQMYGLSIMSMENCLKNKNLITSVYLEKICKDQRFVKSFTGGSSRYESMKTRRDVWDEYMKEIIN